MDPGWIVRRDVIREVREFVREPGYFTRVGYWRNIHAIGINSWQLSGASLIEFMMTVNDKNILTFFVVTPFITLTRSALSSSSYHHHHHHYVIISLLVIKVTECYYNDEISLLCVFAIVDVLKSILWITSSSSIKLCDQSSFESRMRCHLSKTHDTWTGNRLQKSSSEFRRQIPAPLFRAGCIWKLNKKLIRRWDSERELSLRRHRTRTTKYNRLVHKFRQRSTRLCVGTQVYQSQRNNALQRPLRRSRSFKVTDFGTNR